MTKDDKINIKLEVCRDKTSGKLAIMAHFDANAPNIVKDKDGYHWMPTQEETDLINEAFELMPMDATNITPKKTTESPEVKKEVTPGSEPITKDDIQLEPEIKSTVDEQKHEDLPPMEKSDDSAVFKVTKKYIKTDDLDKDIDKKLEDINAKINKPVIEDTKIDGLDTEKIDDKGIIVEADADAIEEALKKHTGDDKDIIAADEQTIVDRVLSQKKKGKWNKR